MTVTRRQWVQRLLAVVAVAVVLCLFFSWMYMGPSWPGILLAALALFSIGWFLSDFGRGLEEPAWTTHQLEGVRRNATDGRMGYLRRVIGRVYEPPPEGTSNQVPLELQQILQQVTAGRLRARAPSAAGDSAIDIISREQHTLDGALAGYLLGAPPPVLDETSLNAFLSRIENL